MIPTLEMMKLTDVSTDPGEYVPPAMEFQDKGPGHSNSPLCTGQVTTKVIVQEPNNEPGDKDDYWNRYNLGQPAMRRFKTRDLPVPHQAMSLSCPKIRRSFIFSAIKRLVLRLTVIIITAGRNHVQHIFHMYAKNGGRVGVQDLPKNIECTVVSSMIQCHAINKDTTAERTTP